MSDPVHVDVDPVLAPGQGVDVARVKKHLGITASDAADDELLGWVVDATNAWVAGIPYVLNRTTIDPTWAWSADIMQGATMLAARWYRRRNTPSGVESMTDNVVYLPRRDGDVDLLLHLTRPVAG